MSAHELITEHLNLWTSATTHAANGRGKNGNIELTGIQKLRELILDLAVRGKLLDQDPNDEDASRLLERIQTKRDALIREGDKNNWKKFPEIREEEHPFEIPDSWEFVRLSNAVEITRGITFPASEKTKSPAPGRIACLRTSNIQRNIETEDLIYVNESFVSKDSQYIRHNDIVMSMANSRELVGKAAIIKDKPKKPITFGGFLGVLRPILINPSFLMAFLRAPTTRTTLIGSASQTTNIANISMGKLNPLVMPLPPLDEQHRIVQKVDELMALCDRLEQQTSDQLEAHETLVDTLLNTLTQSENATELADNWARLAEHFDTLFTTEKSIDKLKQTIWQLAVMGRLVEQDTEEEPIASYLDRIEDEKSKLIANGKLRKRKTPSQIEPQEVPFPIPKGWKWVRLETIAEAHTGYAFKSREYTNSGTFVLRVININKDGTINTKDAKYINPQAAETEYSKFQLAEGDVLLVMVGGSLGKIGLVDSSVLPAVLNQNMWKFQVLGGISTDFFIYGLKQINAYQLAITNSTHGHLSQGAYLSKLFPMPPLEEQYRIVEKVDELTALCDQLKRRLSQASESRAQLAQSVVEQASN